MLGCWLNRDLFMWVVCLFGCMKLNQTVPVHDVVEPELSEKLHPYEDEQGHHNLSLEEIEEIADEQTDENDAEDTVLTSFDHFRLSVGTMPNKPLEVREVEDGVELIDGDRRLRALKSNDADTVPCLIIEEEDGEVTEEDKAFKMMSANEGRRPSNTKRKGEYVAELTAPHRVPPEKRNHDFKKLYSQREVAERIGCSQTSVSNWLDKLDNVHPIRAELNRVIPNGAKATDERVEFVDTIVEHLRNTETEDGEKNAVIHDSITGTEDGISELQAVDGYPGDIQLSQIVEVAREADENEWDAKKFASELEERYGNASTPGSFGDLTEDTGNGLTSTIPGNGSTSNDPSTSESQSPSTSDTDDGDEREYTGNGLAKDKDLGRPTKKSVQNQKRENAEEEDEDDTEEVSSGVNEGVDFGGVAIEDVDWTEFVEDDELPQGQSVSTLTFQNGMTQVDVQDEVSEAIAIVAAVRGETKGEAIESVFGDAIVDRAVDYLGGSEE